MINLYILTGAFLIAVLLGRVIIPNILIISFRKKLFDVPDARKVHKRPIPRLGGVTFFPVIVFTFAVFMAAKLQCENFSPFSVRTNIACEFLYLIAGLTLLYIVGIADDLMGVRYRKKFMVQIVSAALFPIAGLYINDFYGLFGIYTIPSFIGIPLTMLLVVFITNAVNLIDGIDGLASGLSMVTLIIFGVLFIHYRYWNYATLAFICVGVIVPFFAYNVFGNADKGRKIFMGDTGSLTLGYIISFFVIVYCMHSNVYTVKAYGSPVVVVFSMMLVPCLDVVRVVLKRARMRKPLFMPDKNHIHHKFLAMGYTPRRALITIQIMSAMFFAFTFIAVRFVNNTLVFVIDIVAWTMLNMWFNRKVISDEKPDDNNSNSHESNHKTYRH